MTLLWKDLLFAFRRLRNAPGAAVLSIGSLTLGVGASTAIFSVIYTVLLAPPVYQEPFKTIRPLGNK